ncbi:MAG: efflux transporter outer membrane subunit [Novosphingobium sp.]|nr:efflux transporter outer membrane subunit [Novosphingobium sp.]MCP5402227.1 efflux transporter outer membrane subunit [Novosphingobium sp.]
MLPALALAGCKAGPDYVPPQLPANGGAFLRAGDADAAAPAARWWEGLGDPLLTGLIDRGLENEPGIAAAEARLRQARAGLAASRAALFPSFSTSALYVYADLPDNAFGTSEGNNEFYSLGFDAQWELDLWGGQRRAMERARAGSAAAAAELADAHVRLSAEIARAYTSLRAREASLALLDRRHGIETRLVEISRARQRGGTGTRQELAGALQLAERTEAERAAIAADVASLRDALAVLTGTAPGSLDDLDNAEIPLPPEQVAVGDPAAMLARRPDILAAERRLAAATAGIGVEQSRRFPSISLMGLIGIGGTRLGDAFDADQAATLALPQLSWRFLDFGRTGAAVRGAKAGRDAALADYEASVLGALQDVEAALARFGAARIGFARSAQSANRAAEAARLQDMRAKAGAAAPAEGLQGQRDAVNARLAEANDRAGLTLAYVALAKSLGLGWQRPD